MLARNPVEFHHHFHGTESPVVQRNRVALLKVNGDIFRFIGGFFHRDSHDVAFRPRLFPRIFQFPAFKTAVQHVAIHAVVLVGSVHLNAVPFRKFRQRGTGHEIPLSPRGDHREIWGQSVDGQFKTHLVITLAGRAVRDGLSPFSPGNFNKTFGDERAGNGSAHQIAPLVNRSGAHHGVDIVPGELRTQIFDIDFGSSSLPGLGFNTVQVVFLPQVGSHGNDFIPVLDHEPLENDRRIQTAGIGQHYLFDFRHDVPRCGFRPRYVCAERPYVPEPPPDRQ